MHITIISIVTLITILAAIRIKGRWAKVWVIIIGSIIVFITAALLFINYFFSAFAPPQIKITSEFITTNHDFVNGIAIEKITVNSIGEDFYPVKYTMTYRTTCSIKHPIGKPPSPPDKIYFYEKGAYAWWEEHKTRTFIHQGLGRTQLKVEENNELNLKHNTYATCPLQFEREQWYFFTIGDPQVTGIFFYIDKNGNEKQYYLESGVSPI